MRNPIDDHLSTNFEVRTEAGKARKALRSKLESHNADRDDIEDKSHDLRAVPSPEWSTSHEKAATKIRERQREAVVREISIRREMTAWFNLVDQAERPAAVEAALAAYESLQSDVRERLLAIGYEATFDGRDALSDLVARHPQVREARCLVEAIRSDNSNAFRALNEAALRECQKSLEAHKEKSVAGLVA